MFISLIYHKGFKEYMFKNNIIILFLFLFSCSTNISNNINSNNIIESDIPLKNKIAQMVMIRANGEFEGGQLIPGLQLQRSAMSNRAEMLKPVKSFVLPTKEFP